MRSHGDGVPVGAPSPGLPWCWGATEEERLASYPCERLLEEPGVGLLRAVDVHAPAATTFRWLCQLRVAPYSYDLIDNLGRRSPRQLTPGAEQLAVGQRLLVGEILDFTPNEHISGRLVAPYDRIYGREALSYVTTPAGATRCRLLGRIAVPRPRALWERARLTTLAWGDLIMMRKQLCTLKALAERDHRGTTSDRQ